MFKINIQNKINKIILALFQYERIVKIQTQENYSLKFKKIFRIYKVIETTEREIEVKKEFYKLKKEYKNRIKPPDIENRLEILKTEMKSLKIPVIEFKNKIEVLKYLIERYKKFKEEELSV